MSNPPLTDKWGVRLPTYIGSLMLLVTSLAFAAPPAARPSQNVASTDSLSYVKTHLTDLKHRLNGIEQIVRSLKEKIENQDTSVLHFQEELGKELKDRMQESAIRCTDVENQFFNFKSGLQAVVDDLGTVRTRINELINTSKEEQERISTLETTVKVQTGQLKLLESALSSLTKLLQSRAGISSDSVEAAKTYRVQPGDTLEKIAKQHKVTVSAIRQVNQLEDLDKIRVNQTLKIP